MDRHGHSGQDFGSQPKKVMAAALKEHVSKHLLICLVDFALLTSLLTGLFIARLSVPLFNF